MGLVETIRARAKAAKKHIVLPEGTEMRTLQAAERITKEGIATITLLGEPESVKKAAAQAGADISGISIVNPKDAPDFQDYADTYFKLRESKGMTPEKAVDGMRDPLCFGVMMVYKGICHGMVAGAENATSNVLRPAFQILKTKPGVTTVSGSFIMVTKNQEMGDQGVYIFADCAVSPVLTAEQMAEVAWCSAEIAKEIAGIAVPKVAMLSFSTKGSASHESADKVIEATRIARERYPDLLVDGELQMDAAVAEAVGKSKAPGSAVAGHANVLIFPSLESGNIAYKAVQYFGNAQAIGPILQGLAKPVNDLSRGCSIDDIVNTVAVVCCQS